MAQCLGDQTRDWQHRSPVGSVAGFYYAEALSSSQGAHVHLWIDGFDHDSREVRRAVRRLERSHDVQSWSFSPGVPGLSLAGGDSDDAPPRIAPAPFLGEPVLRREVESVIAVLRSRDGGNDAWLAAEAERLEALLHAPASSPVFTKEEAIEESLRTVAKCFSDWMSANGPDDDLAQVVRSIRGLLQIDAEADMQDLSASQKAIHMLTLTSDGTRLAPKHLKLLEMAVNRQINDEGLAAFDAVYRNVVTGNYDSMKVWLCGVEDVTRDNQGYVYFKGNHVDHFSHSDATEMRQAAEMLSLICLRLERLGRPIGLPEYLASFEEMKDFPAQKYFVTAPIDPRFGAQTRYTPEVVRVHAYRNQRDLAEALRPYVAQWDDCPIRSAAALRSLYCTDADWECAKGMDATCEAHR